MSSTLEKTVKQKPRRDDPDDRNVTSSSDFSHPVFKRLSQINGAINRLHKEELQQRLENLHLSAGGNKDVLRKRLKNYYKNQKLMQSKVCTPKESRYDYILVIDFEATCESTNPNNFDHEIIEFPVVVIDCDKKAIVNEFHQFVKPTKNPRLTSFCTTLTGITQEQVNAAEPFPVVLDKMWNWLVIHGYHKHMAVLTDGPWDMSRFMFLSCQLNELKYPKWAKKWINIRKTFSNFYDCQRRGLKDMLEMAGYGFDGQPHSGIDDSRNIAKLAIRLLEDGCTFIVNEKIDSEKLNENSQLVKKKAEVQPLTRRQAEASEDEDSDPEDGTSEHNVISDEEN